METFEPPIQLSCGPARLIRSLGTGGSAHAWLVMRDDEPCTLKVAAPEHSRVLASEAQRLVLAHSLRLPRASAVGRLPREGQLPEALERWRGCPYLLLGYAEGRTLRELMATFEAPQSEALARAVANDVGRALDDLHTAGVAHGDVKPDNIIVGQQGDRFRCTLIDLGLAGAIETPTVSGATLRYLAPEVIAQRPSDARSRDMWALGITLLEVLCIPARQSREPSTHLQDCAASWQRLLSLLLCEQPEVRPRAQWVVRQLPRDPHDGDIQMQATEAQVRIARAYLHARRDELHQVTTGRPFTITVGGPPRAWLQQACQTLCQLGALQDPAAPRAPEKPAYEFGDASPTQQQRWLLRLMGSPPIDVPPLPPRSDEQLAERLLELSRRVALEAVPLAALLDDSEPERITPSPEPFGAEAGVDSEVELALCLGAEAPEPKTLEAVERRAQRGAAPAPLVLSAARALKRQHELARSRALLLLLRGPEAEFELAAVDARSGNLPQACKRLTRLLALELPAELRSQAQALLTRAYLGQGDVASAEAALRAAPPSAAALESLASVALVRGELEQAERHLWRATALDNTAEQRARLEALFANLHQQRGDSRQALEYFRRAAEHAARARAILEEATYLSGVSANACNLGRVAEALTSAERALLLFDWLENDGAAARAELARATALGAVGAHAEALDAALACLARARRTQDQRCQMFAHLLLCDVEREPAALAHLERATHLAQGQRAEDELRVAARRLRWGQLSSRACSHYNSVARESESMDARLEWWGASARAALSKTQTSGSQAVLAELMRLLNVPAAVETRGQAFAYGARLAAQLGDGSAMRHFTAGALEAQRLLEAGAPPELRFAARQLQWARELSPKTDSGWRPEQLYDIDKLIQALSERERLSVLLDRVLDALVAWTGVERGLLLLRSPNGQLKPRAARNLARQDLRGEQLELSLSLAHRALQAADSVVLLDASHEIASLHHSVHSLKLRSVLAVPLVARGSTLGVVYLDDRTRAGAFGPSEMTWVRFAARLAALAIADARDQLLLRRAARRARRAEQRLEEALAKTHAELEVAERELSRRQRGGYRYRYDEIVGESAALHGMLQLLDRVTASDVPVLIAGESGSGKELVARAIHRNGPRKDQPFVSENCAAIPDGLLESLLFGHVKGAFTGASRQHAGLFEIAHRGTLFLDEIADMSLAMQSKLLRVLETGMVRRVGSEKPIRVDVRVLGASHKPLPELVRQGQFRQDLYYRLNVITIEVPPLQQRREDIPLLVRHFLEQFAPTPPPTVTPAALALLQQHDWPGNVRQLQNEIRRAIVLSDGIIDTAHLTLDAPAEAAAPQGLNLRQHIELVEQRLIRAALRQTGGNQTRAAELLGVSRFGLQKMLKRLNLHSAAG